MKKSHIVAAVAVAASAVSFAEATREAHFQYLNNRLTLRPYLSLSYTYDSNVDSTKHSQDGSQWVVQPALEASYLDDNWKVDGKVWYNYHAYNRYTHQLNSSSYGELLSLTWANSRPDEAGWLFKFVERFQQIAQDDDMSNHGGRGIGRDRKQFNTEGLLERRINERLHGAVNASYYLLDYENDVHKYASLFGWKRAVVGGELGYAVNGWMDFLVAADYQWYWQDNDTKYGAGESSSYRHRVYSDSRGWSLMGGIATRATEKLSYRLLGGWSRFEYGDGAKDIDGWTYRANADWQIDDDNTWHVMLVGASYYQPSERERGSAIKVYHFGAGTSKSLVRRTLRATFDLNYRKETHEFTQNATDDYDTDIWTTRVALIYRLNNIASIFGRVEYQSQYCTGGRIRNNAYDYDRWRGTVGVTLSY